MADRRDIEAFVSGTHNLISDELIPNDAASESIGWLTKDGRIELMYGRQSQGNEGLDGKVWAQHTGYTTNGTAVFFRKIWDGTEGKVQYLLSGTWTDVITGLANADMTFTNYASVAGNFVFCGSPDDGIFKIVTANPGTYADMYLSTKNFKGYFYIDKARSIMWNTKDDTSGLYGSYIDSQDSDVYTTVTSEAITAVESGTLAFKAGGATRNCFAVAITDTSSGEVFTDNYDGTLTGDAGGTGTINYMSGVFTITGQTGAGTADYQWEDSNANGVTDFSKSATRLAGEGFVIRQDAGGDATKVVIPFDGSYFSFKENSVYQFTLDNADTNPTNELIRTDVGVETLRAAVGTSTGIMYLNTGNPTRPMLNILQRNPVGDNFITTPYFPQFKFQNYTYTQVALAAWDKYVVVACASDSANNNRMLMCDMQTKTVDVAPYGASCFNKDSGFLYSGDPVAQTSYETFTGFDDMAGRVTNSWESKADLLNTKSLKRVKHQIFRGQIDPAQEIKVSIEIDAGGYQHVGTILGSGDYVDYNTSYALGTSFIGRNTIGGDDEATVYDFIMKLKIRVPKFRKRKIKLEALEYGYCALEQITDFDIWQYEDKLPKKYRSKQNVSLDGETTDEANPTY
jgi:hypothetical protein